MSETIKPLTKKDGETKDLVATNVERLKELFPEIVTEGKIDFEALKEVLGDFSDDNPERYSFTWNGKSQARKIAMTPSMGTLRPAPEESVNWDTTENVFIEGDNLEVLKLLQRSYHKKVKMIYIDPPYNTGNDFVYNDDFKDNLSNYLKITGQKDGEGNKITSNPETSGRYHTDWLNMMYPRLKLARELLREDGVVFISIDDNELSNLKKMCDEVFGEENFVSQLIWKRRQNVDSRSKTGVSVDHEYIVCYRKTDIGRIRGAEKDLNKYSNPDNDPDGDWMSADMTGLATKDQRPNLHYDLTDPKTGIKYDCPPTGWRYEPKRMEEFIANDEILFPTKPDGRPRRKKFLKDLESTYTGLSTVLDTVYNTQGTREVRSIFDEKEFFDFPKPKDLLKLIIQQGSSEDEGTDIVLDFFAGSGTSAHATYDLNKDDNRKRKFIVVQLPEKTKGNSEAFKQGLKTLADISKERIRRSGYKIKEEYPEYEGDLGFKVFKLDTSNIKPWDASFDDVQLSLEDSIENVKPDRTEEDVLYEILLKYGLDLTLPIEEKEIAGAKVFVGGAGALVLCLSAKITTDVVDGIAKLKDELNPEFMRVVFRDSGFKDDVVKTNAVQILKQHGIEDMRSI